MRQTEVEPTTQDSQDYFDAHKYDQIDKLMKLRMYGQYKNDLAGFVDKLKLIKNAKNTGPPVAMDIGSVGNVLSPAA